MPELTSFTKDPAAVLDYAFDWAAWLAAGETITAHTVTVPAGITKDTSAAAAGIVTVWLSGGTVGDAYPVACRVTTSQGRTDERTITVRVHNR